MVDLGLAGRVVADRAVEDVRARGGDGVGDEVGIGGGVGAGEHPGLGRVKDAVVVGVAGDVGQVAGQVVADGNRGERGVTRVGHGSGDVDQVPDLDDAGALLRHDDVRVEDVRRAAVRGVHDELQRVHA